MNSLSSRTMVIEIMTEFPGLTGLLPAGKSPRRYLWTDAFAVCNFLGLYQHTRDEIYKELALKLVEQVHTILGRHREDDPRAGWISGLGEEEGRRHPTSGGLRIGKSLNERKSSDPFHEELEWDRDGQYYHYLTRWMHALNRVSGITGEMTYHRWAMELAKTAYARFTYVPRSGGEKRMYWKMSIDLSYPLVPSMGQHDPLDGLVTCLELQARAPQDAGEFPVPDLREEIAGLESMCEGKRWATDDALGIGGLLCDVYRVAQLLVNGNLGNTSLPEQLMEDSQFSLELYSRDNSLKLPASYRLAFRELGLTIGLRGVERLNELVTANPEAFPKRSTVPAQVESLRQYLPLIEKVERFWLDSRNRETASWKEHQDINMVMLATSLAPDGYLSL